MQTNNSTFILHLFLIRFTVPTRHNLTQKQTKKLTPVCSRCLLWVTLGSGVSLRTEVWSRPVVFFFQTVYFKYICWFPLSFSVANKGLHLISVLPFQVHSRSVCGQPWIRHSRPEADFEWTHKADSGLSWGLTFR